MVLLSHFASSLKSAGTKNNQGVWLERHRSLSPQK